MGLAFLFAALIGFFFGGIPGALLGMGALWLIIFVGTLLLHS